MDSQDLKVRALALDARKLPPEPMASAKAEAFFQALLSATNRDSLPDELLDYTAILFLEHLNQGSDGVVAQGPVKSITRGDTTIAYASGEEAQGGTAEAWLRGDRVLARYRKARGLRYEE